MNKNKIVDNNYIIAIPSYKRPQTLKNKTMNILKKHNINPNKIYIFVSDKEEKKIYKNEIDSKFYNKMVIGKPGIKNIRNFMPNYFKEGQKIFYMDDDIKEIYQNFNNNKIINKIGSNYDKKKNKLKVLKDLDKFILDAFRIAQKLKIDNWGIYPVENPYFMKPTSKNVDDYISTNLSYIIGFMTGVINNRKCEKRTIDDKEDYERSIKYYLKDNGLLRFNNITCGTNCYKEPGGMQIERTKKRVHDSAVYLTKKYSELCSLNTQKKSGYSEIRLRDKRISNNKNNNIKKIDLSIPNTCSLKNKLPKKNNTKNTLKRIPISKLPI